MRKADGFREVKAKVLRALAEGNFQHAERQAADVKNLLQLGAVSVEEVSAVILRCNGHHHSRSPHHWAPEVMVHVLRRDGWYIKFYFVDPNTVFVSVHR